MIVITYTTSLLEILCKKKTVKLVFVQLTNSKQRNPNGILQTVIIVVKSKNEKKNLSPLLRIWFKANIGVTDLPLAANDFIFMHLQKIGPNIDWRRCVSRTAPVWEIPSLLSCFHTFGAF